MLNQARAQGARLGRHSRDSCGDNSTVCKSEGAWVAVKKA